MGDYRIPFHKPHITGNEVRYLTQAITRGNIASDGEFTRACSQLLEERLGIRKVLLVPSCTAALEMAAMLCNLAPGDEVIMPSYTFVSTATAFIRVGARPVFVEIRPDTLNLDPTKIEAAITDRTKAIAPVHYGGVACEMNDIMDVARRHDLIVVEDAAQAVNAYYQGRALGSIGHLGCYSFHDTKNYVCGEGGALCVNDYRFQERAEILRDKGTNRQKFLRGEVDKYTWVDLGSSYVISELCSAFLLSQLECLDRIRERRRELYQRYACQLQPLCDRGLLRTPEIPPHCVPNFHIFYVLLNDSQTRDALMEHLKATGIHAVFHYVPLHTSPMGRALGYRDGDLPVTETVAARLLRLPLYVDMDPQGQDEVIHGLFDFFRKQGQVTNVASP